MKKILMMFAILGMGISTSGCLLGAAAGAGYIAADEINEDDGEFDPLEEAYDDDPETAGPLDRED